MAVPTFVVDAPGGAGKIPLMPNYLISQSDRRLILRNYEGMITTYTQPKETVSGSYETCEICNDPNLKSDEGIARLLNGDQLFLIPENLRRKGN
jgi:lysine 2,3-aminomutase